MAAKINQCSTSNPISFQEAIEKANQLKGKQGGETQKNLLIGNGFSMEYDEKIFSYSSLYEIAGFSKELNNIFENFKTKDFEVILKKIVDSIEVNQKYNVDSNIINAMEKDIDIIKKSLLTAVSKLHPKSSTLLQENEYIACKNFLKNFVSNHKKNCNNIFTINYDLLLYWVLVKWMKEEKKEPTDFVFRDSFYNKYEKSNFHFCEWIDDSSMQNLFYLHGSLHIFEEDGKIIKYNYQELQGINLKQQISKSLDKKIYPLFVSGDSSYSKLSRINYSPYLRKCLKKLSNIKDALFIFGHSMCENDNHIYNALLNAKELKYIFVGVRKVESVNNILNRINAFVDLYNDKWKHAELEIIFYNTKSANVWGSN